MEKEYKQLAEEESMNLKRMCHLFYIPMVKCSNMDIPSGKGKEGNVASNWTSLDLG